MQSKKRSFAEAWMNIAIGYSVNFTANLIILPLFGFDVTIKQNLFLGGLYTLVSLARSYCIRRWFNLGDDKRKEAEK